MNLALNRSFITSRVSLNYKRTGEHFVFLFVKQVADRHFRKPLFAGSLARSFCLSVSGEIDHRGHKSMQQGCSDLVGYY